LAFEVFFFGTAMSDLQVGDAPAAKLT